MNTRFTKRSLGIFDKSSDLAGLRIIDRKPPAISLLFKVVDLGKQRTVVLIGENNADLKLLEIANSLPARIPTDDLRKALEPHLTAKTDTARYKAFQRLRDKLLETGLIVLEGSEYLRST